MELFVYATQEIAYLVLSMNPSFVSLLSLYSLYGRRQEPTHIPLLALLEPFKALNKQFPE